MICFLFSCSNATCAIPEAYRETFAEAREEVESTAGWEPGALNLGQAFAMHFRTPLVHGETSRLLINLEEEGEEQWSPHSMKLPESTRKKITERHATAYRSLLRQRINDGFQRGKIVLHVLIHTQTGGSGTIDIETPNSSSIGEDIASQWSNLILGEGIYTRLRTNSGASPLSRSLAANYPQREYVQIRFTVADSFFLDGKPQKWSVIRKLSVGGLENACAEV